MASRAQRLADSSRRVTTLDELIRWGLLQSPELMITSVVVQDEYTHDVIVSDKSASVFLVYDSN
jgi:hypothetical protein